MAENIFFTQEEYKELFVLYKKLLKLSGDTLQPNDCKQLKQNLIEATKNQLLVRDVFGLNPILKDMQTAIIVADEIGMRRASILSIMLHDCVKSGFITTKEVEKKYGQDVSRIINGLVKISDLYAKNPTIESENFRNLLLSFAEDMRVILIMIADRVNVMRQIKDAENIEARKQVANEAAYLYAPLAHKLGLYRIKSELEDLFLKYTETEQYYMIKDKLNQTKASRDKYIQTFIEPIRKKLNETGLKFHMKGRTKSIHSIWQKIKKQHTTFENIYDLFAIRIILDSPLDKEKQQCWQVYSIVTDMYTPNPNRLRDWLSIPKSNGYESLHITVMGPQGKWVEIQIRTERMDEIAERGLAAHWRYKGIKSESGLDEWLTTVREALENSDNNLQIMDQFKMDLYEDEIFVFTPKGDLFKLSKDATVLDFAFTIHTNIGCRCVGAKVNGKNVPIRQKLKSGDQVEVLTSSSQQPKQDWLNIVTTSKAKTKIRQSLKEIAARQSDIAKETLDRKFKNRKIEYDESILMRLIKKEGYKQLTDFYQGIAEDRVDINDLLDKYQSMLIKKDSNTPDTIISAENYSMQEDDALTNNTTNGSSTDVLVIDQNLKGIDFSLAKCCHPIYGDKIFGFVTVNGGIKIHRTDCPNAPTLRSKFNYRIVKARWAGKSTGMQYAITLSVIGIDDIGIVNNITSIISKEGNTIMRSINIDSNDGLFSGNITVLIDDTSKLESLIKKLKAVKGVKQISRI